MKNLFFLGFCLMSLLFASCENDIFEPPVNSSDDPISTRGKGDESAGVEVSNNGRWLVFSDVESYQEAYDRLLNLDDSEPNKEEVVLTKDEKGDYGTTYDPNTNLALWEIQVGHQSLRRAVALEEDQGLRAGDDPAIVNVRLDDRDVTDVITQTLFSQEGVIQIGSTMYFAATPGLMIEVENNRTDLMTGILDVGTDIIFDNNNHDDIRLKPKSTFFGVKDCTADFGSFAGFINEEEGTAQYTFLWNLGDIAGAIDPQFTWNFGDGTSETSSSPFIYHQFTNLQPNQDNNFTICLSASYTLVDEEGNETLCNNSHCESITIKYEEEVNDDPLFTCDDAQIVGSILQTIGLVDLLSITPTPGNAEQVCVNGTNLVLGSAALMDAITFTWNFQGQTGEGLQACFIAPCDGTYSITLEISLEDGTSCLILAQDYQHNVEANCEGKIDIQVEEPFEYMIGGDRHKVCLRAKHQTKLDNNIFDWGKNQIETQQKSYKKRWFGWQKVSKRHEIRLEGNVYPSGDACYCEGVPDYLDPSIDFRIKTEKNTKYYKQMFPSAEGIFCKVNDPYKVTFNENNGSVIQSYEFPQ